MVVVVSSPQAQQSDNFLSLCQELRTLHLQSLWKNQRKLKAASYSTSKKAGKALARRIKVRQVKAGIAYLTHPHTKDKPINPQSIDDCAHYLFYFWYLYSAVKFTQRFLHIHSYQFLPSRSLQPRILAKLQGFPNSIHFLTSYCCHWQNSERVTQSGEAH